MGEPALARRVSLRFLTELSLVDQPAIEQLAVHHLRFLVDVGEEVGRFPPDWRMNSLQQLHAVADEVRANLVAERRAKTLRFPSPPLPGANTEELIIENVLFSAALGGEPFELLWDLASAGKVELITTRYCHAEGLDNLKHKRPAVLERYAGLMERVTEVPDGATKLEWANELVPAKDAPVLAAAVAAGATVLVTGDLKHFASLMAREDLPVRVRTVQAFPGLLLRVRPRVPHALVTGQRNTERAQC